MACVSRWMRLSGLVAAGLVAFVSSLFAEVSVPTFFSDHMVLQRDMPVAVWGWAEAGESVAVQLGDKPAVTASAGADGAWKVSLPATAAGGPFVLSIKGKNEIRIADVLVGEVWLCSGQSNMEMVVASCLNFEQEKQAANDPAIRQLLVPKRPASQPEVKMDARWTECSPATVGGFTACGYFMAKHLRKELNVPIGLINSSWGGTRIEPWIPVVGFKNVPAVQDIYRQLQALDPKNPECKKKLVEHLDRIEAWSKKARAALESGAPLEPAPALPPEMEPLANRRDPQQQPTTLYNGMIHALVGYGMRGAIWYQGESNHYEGLLYTEKMKALVGGWRQVWGIGDFPFNFVQIAPFQYGEDVNILPKFWVAQSAALTIPNTGMVVTTDISTLNDIHPRNKQEVGRRLALIALAKTYGKAGTVCDGPTLKAIAAEGSKLRVTFNNAVGLASRDGKPLTWFEIVGEDTDFVKADVSIEGDTVVLSSPQVAKPVAMRFSWHRDAEPNLVNGAGLPAAAFTAGGIPYVDSLAKVPEAKGYELVYALDLAKLGGSIAYETDNSGKLAGAFDRIAYFLELQMDGRPVQYAWASMDAFTKDAKKIGIPTVASGASFQQKVANLTVQSNVKDVASGSFPEGGNIEFWPNNYGPNNNAKVPNASDTVFDFGDFVSDPKDGYGSMQVHNYGAQQTVLAVNHWVAGGGADLGIGNSQGETRDWTFKANAGSYAVKKLRVFVRLKQ